MYNVSCVLCDVWTLQVCNMSYVVLCVQALQVCELKDAVFCGESAFNSTEVAGW